MNPDIRTVHDLYREPDEVKSVYGLLHTLFGKSVLEIHTTAAICAQLERDFPTNSYCGVECAYVLEAYIDSRNAFPDFQGEYAKIAIRQCLVICFG